MTPWQQGQHRWIRSAPPAAGAAEENGGPTFGSPWDSSGPDACWGLPQPTLLMEVDDGVTVPVRLDEQNSLILLEVTQQARERHEREVTGLPPVYNFGSDWTHE